MKPVFPWAGLIDARNTSRNISPVSKMERSADYAYVCTYSPQGFIDETS